MYYARLETDRVAKQQHDDNLKVNAANRRKVGEPKPWKRRKDK